MDKNRIIPVAILTLFLACKQDAVAPAISEENDIRESVLRDLIVHSNSGLSYDTTLTVVYFEFRSASDSAHRAMGDHIDPNSSFLERFKDIGFPVKPGSGCTYSSLGEVIDKVTAEHGVLFYVGPVSKLATNSARVDGWFYVHANNRGGFTLELVRENGQWTVASRTMNYFA